MTGLLLRDAELDGRARADIRVRGDRVTEIGQGLTCRRGESLVRCRGGAVLPGLCDHHLHLHALAAHQCSVPCGPPAVRDRDELGATLTAAAADEHGWVRGVGYVETVAGHLDAIALDTLHSSRPVRVQHRSGSLWMVNSRAAELLGLRSADHPGIERDPSGAPSGRLWRADDWLRGRLPGAGPPDLAAVGARLAALGITAVTDATPDLEPEALTAISTAMRSGALPQRVHLLGAPLGRPAPDGPTIGPYKIVLADSGLPALDELTDRIRSARDAGRAVAAHCVTVEALVLLLAALDDAGGARPGDRVEHAALVPAPLIGQLAARGLRVVTQPGFLADRGDDYLRDVPANEHGDLYRCGSLVDTDIAVALSSDAPYGLLDPWTVIDTAATRQASSGQVVNGSERLSRAAALDRYLASADDPGGRPRRIRPGGHADLILLDVPRHVQLQDPRAEAVRMTLVAGRTVT